MIARSPLIFAALFAAAAMALASTAEAHADHYSQSAYVTVKPDGVEVELDLSPGAFVAEQVVSAIDSDGDGALSAAEQRAYAGAVLQDLSLRIDDQPVTLALASLAVPPASHLRTGEDRMILTFAAALPEPAPGPHRLAFRNAHQLVKSAHQAHSIAGTKTITIGKQTRNDTQEELTADFVMAGPPAAAMTTATAAAATTGTSPFIVFGLFLCGTLALVVSSRKKREP